MWRFRTYLEAKCGDSVFREHYHDQCNICPNTVKIISTIRERGLDPGQVAKQAGISPVNLELLESADRCSFDEVQKLSRCLGLPVPAECKKQLRSNT